MTGDLPLGPVVRPGVVRDDLDRHYTPIPLATEILRRLRAERCPLSMGWVLEPSVGGGSFVVAAHEVGGSPVYVAGVDVDPDARGLRHVDVPEVADFPAWAARVTDPCVRAAVPWGRGPSSLPLHLVVGNPPFSARGKADQLRTRLNIRAALDVADAWNAWCALILPSAFVLGGEAWSWLDDEPECRPSDLWPITRRPWGDRVRETSVYVWRPRSERERDGWPGPRVGRRVVW